VTGVPAALVRGAARLYATGGNAANLLRPWRDGTQPGNDHGDGHRQPAMATGNLGREGSG